MGCASIDYTRMDCYKTDSCGPFEDTPVTARAVAVDYKTDLNGFPKEIVVHDNMTNNNYRMLRASDGRKTLKLERIVEKRPSDCPQYLDCDWQGPVK
ncbi:hypothetical protein HZB00_00765 [Candidatus Woesearchaeota archaeon]|nr:hypothetical protein [Candidatus Woesearchaeota archaeon]